MTTVVRKYNYRIVLEFEFGGYLFDLFFYTVVVSASLFCGKGT